MKVWWKGDQICQINLTRLYIWDVMSVVTIVSWFIQHYQGFRVLCLGSRVVMTNSEEQNDVFKVSDYTWASMSLGRPWPCRWFFHPFFRPHCFLWCWYLIWPLEMPRLIRMEWNSIERLHLASHIYTFMVRRSQRSCSAIVWRPRSGPVKGVSLKDLDSNP